MSRVQRFQGGVKNGSSRSPSKSLQPVAAAGDVLALRRLVARRPELAFAALDLVVRVRVAVLVQPGVTVAQPRRERLVQLRRDDGEIEWQAVLGEPRDQLQQPRILPPGVVVTEEDVHRAGCGIQAPGKQAHARPWCPTRASG